MIAGNLTIRLHAQTPAASEKPSVKATSETLVQGDYELNRYKLDINEWPKTVFSFALENRKKDSFRQLKISDIQVATDETDLALSPGMLRLTSSEPVGVFILLDGSRSMLGGSLNFNKLAAAKDAIKAFLKNLDANDSAAIYGFDSELYIVSDPATKATDLTATIDRFQPREGEFSRHTDLYRAIKDAIEKARSYKIRNLVVISDGMQDTKDSEDIRLSGDEEFSAFKSLHEQEIVELATKSGMTIFSIPIGDKNSLPPIPKNLDYVDADTLCNVMSRHIPEKCPYVSLPDLALQAVQDTSESRQAVLEQQLKKIFEIVNYSVRYDYALDLSLLKFVPDNREHVLKINVKAGGKLFTVTYPITWTRGAQKPNLGGPSITKRVLIETPKIVITNLQLSGVYVFGLTVLIILALAPIVLQRAERSRKVRETARTVNRSIMVVKDQSDFSDRPCPNHKNFPKPFQKGDVIIVCPACKEPHHLGCWQYNKGRCMKWLCQGELAIPGEILKKYGVTVT